MLGYVASSALVDAWLEDGYAQSGQKLCAVGFAVDFNLRVFKPHALAVGPTSDGNQHAAIFLRELLPRFFERDLDSAVHVFQSRNFRFEIDVLEDFGHPIS